MMKSVYVFVSVTVIFFALCFMATVSGNAASHWCPSTEIRRVVCMKNVSIKGRSPVAKRVYQWKKEVVLRCCPGFMGPNCQKACFSCQQWAEVAGRVHHLEKFLTKVGSSQHISGKFQPFKPNAMADKVCWTKDGRPVYAGKDLRGSRSVDDRTMERSRNGAELSSYNDGCSIHSRRDISTLRDERHHVSSPHIFMRQQKRQKQQPYQGKQQPMSIAVDARRRGRRGDPVSSQKRRTPILTKSAYQKHPPFPSNRKSAASRFKPTNRVASLASSVSSSKSSPSLSEMKLIIKRRSDVDDDDLDLPYYRYVKSIVNHQSDFATRLSTLERQMVDLERKMSALSPALTTVITMKDSISQLTDKIEILQRFLETTSTEKTTTDKKVSQTDLPSSDCEERCSDQNAPPLPDKEVVQALFPNSSNVVKALDKGHQEFYQEEKKELEHIRNEDKHLDGGDLDSPLDRDDEVMKQERKMTKEEQSQHNTEYLVDKRSNNLYQQMLQDREADEKHDRKSYSSFKKSQSNRAHCSKICTCICIQVALTIYALFCCISSISL